jgi:hypothetical protein
MFAGSRAASSLAQIIAQNRWPTTCGVRMAMRALLSFFYGSPARLRPHPWRSPNRHRIVADSATVAACGAAQADRFSLQSFKKPRGQSQ